jgi:hypothetical protein
MLRWPIGRGKNERAQTSMGQRKRKEDWRRRCEWCDTLIADTADRRKRFCDRRCKGRDYTALLRRERAKARAKLKCQHCGKRIKGAKRVHKYCSLTCQERARYWRHVEARRERNRSYSRRRAALLAALLAASEPALLARLEAEPIPSAVPSPARPQPAP